MARHAAGDFDVGATYVPGDDRGGGYGGGGGGAMDPSVSVSKFDGRPLFSPPEHGPRSPPRSPQPRSPVHRGPTPTSPLSPLSPGALDQSVSRFDGRPLGPHAHTHSPHGAHGYYGEPHHHHGQGARSLSPGAGPFDVASGHVDQHRRRQELDLQTDCMGGGNALMKRIRALFFGTPEPLGGNGVCFYDDRNSATMAESAAPDVTFQYVGQGRYEEMPYRVEDHGLVPNAQHTGLRGAFFEPAAPVPGQRPHWRMRPCCVAILYASIALAAVVLVGALFSWYVASQRPAFDCDADLADAMRGWSFQKKAWCCEHEEKGCMMAAHGLTERGVSPEELGVVVTSTSTTTGTTPAYACDVLRSEAWSPGETAWCCIHERRGCPATTTPLPWDCEAGLETWSTSWPSEKRGWCCEHQRVGCAHAQLDVELPPKPIGPGYNCEAGFSNWEAGWSIVKKAWCCEFENKGCPYTTTTLDGQRGCDTDCEYQGESSTCKSRVNWVVQHLQHSCHEALHHVLQECDVCHQCSVEGASCRDPFECDSDQNHWGQSQKEYCCRTEGRACPDPNAAEPTERPYDCDEDFESWNSKWSIPKKFWCCAQERRGCESYHCDDGSPLGWPLGQKFWCCKTAQRGCDALPFDCDAGLSSWYVGWSDDKKAWCCEHTEKGCVKYDCHAGKTACALGWSDDKKEWCGQHFAPCDVGP